MVPPPTLGRCCFPPSHRLGGAALGGAVFPSFGWCCFPPSPPVEFVSFFLGSTMIIITATSKEEENTAPRQRRRMGKQHRPKEKHGNAAGARSHHFT